MLILNDELKCLIPDSQYQNLQSFTYHIIIRHLFSWFWIGWDRYHGKNGIDARTANLFGTIADLIEEVWKGDNKGVDLIWTTVHLGCNPDVAPFMGIISFKDERTSDETLEMRVLEPWTTLMPRHSHLFLSSSKRSWDTPYFEAKLGYSIFLLRGDLFSFNEWLRHCGVARSGWSGEITWTEEVVKARGTQASTPWGCRWEFRNVSDTHKRSLISRTAWIADSCKPISS